MSISPYKILSYRPHWKWFRALYLYDMNDVTKLASMIETEDIPIQIKKQITDIVSGQRSPNKNSASKLKVKPDQRLNLLVKLYDYEEERIELIKNFYKQKKEFELLINIKSVQHSENYDDKKYLKKELQFSRGPFFEKEHDEMVRINFKKTCLQFGEKPSTIRPSYVKFRNKLQKWPYL